jgi:DNA gyrase subunit B
MDDEKKVNDIDSLKITALKEKEQTLDEKLDASIKMKDVSVVEERSDEKASANYNAGNIQVLDGLEAVRIRPGMYIGSTSSTGLHHLVWEIIDNSVDEALAGYCTHISVTINKDGSCTVEDNGRGIPVDIVAKTGKSAVETVYTILHAGGKFGEGGGYKVAGGLHGVGASVVNALSSFCDVTVNKDGGKYHIRFVNGGHAEKPLERIGDSSENGTLVTFAPDPTIFTETTNFDYSVVRSRCRQMAYLNHGVTFVTQDLRGETPIKDEFCFDGGIREYISYIDQNKQPINTTIKKDIITCPIIYCEGAEEVQLPGSEKTERIYVEVALEWCDVFTNGIYSYCNNISTNDGGTHEVGFKTALSFEINDYDKKFISKNEENRFTIDDCLEGITAVISVKHPNPQYEGQTKGKLGNSEIRPVVYKIVKEGLERFFLENKKIAELIISKVEIAQKGRIRADSARNASRQSGKFSTLAGKLSNCSSKNPAECELFIVEGNSAAGTAKDGRDAKTQAVLPLRGKILNTQKASDNRIFENVEIGNMIQAIGAGFADTFDVSKIRYDKVIIMTDADVDGAHIRILLLTFFFNFMRDLIKYGHVYVAQPPLYKVDYQRKSYYCYTDEQLDKLKAQLKLNNNYTMQRYKGLGEMDKDQLAETTMEASHRRLVQVSLDDAVEADRIFSELMGTEVEPRKEYISENAQFVKNLDI